MSKFNEYVKIEYTVITVKPNQLDSDIEKSNKKRAKELKNTKYSWINSLFFSKK